MFADAPLIRFLWEDLVLSIWFVVLISACALNGYGETC